jgi:hypothetical protein
MFGIWPSGWIVVAPVVALLLTGALIGAGVRHVLNGDA